MSDRRLDSSETHLKLIILLAVEEEREEYQYCSPSLLKRKPEKNIYMTVLKTCQEKKTLRTRITELDCATLTVTALQMKHSNLNEDFCIQCETLPAALERGSP